MKAFYRELYKWLVLASAVASLAGCSFASVSSKPGTYSMNGYSTTPEMAAQVMSENYVNEMNAETYRDCVKAGQCYGYPGGGYGNDYQYYFGNVIPPAGSVQPAVQPNGSSGYATEEELRKVEEKANDSLRMHKKLKEKLQLDQSQH